MSGRAYVTAPSLPIVTALPAAPVDGQTINFLADAANGAVWQLRFRAASASAYKWEFIGGSPLIAEDAADRVLVSDRTVYQAVGSDPALTLPLGGDYMIALGARAYSTAGAQVYLSYAVGAAAALDADAAWGAYSGLAGATYVDNITRTRRKTGLAAVTLSMRQRASVNFDSAFSNRWITATPVRVG